MGSIQWAERGWLPDDIVRWGIRRLIAGRLAELPRSDVAAHRDYVRGFVETLRRSPIALATDAANQQHYEVPAAFFRHVLGRRMKYSCCLWPHGTRTLDEAEEAMLELTCQRAGIEDGMDVLDLGCGWGALSLWIADRYSRCRVLGVSNSHGQREFILGEAQRRGLPNVEVKTANIVDFTPERSFDRVVTVEMFEHLRNYEAMLRRIASWLRPEGKLFVHIFCHRDTPYTFENQGASDWMGREFFTGGMMPSDDLVLYFQRDLLVEEHWRVPGHHPDRTCGAWLERLDANRDELRGILAVRHGAAADRQLQKWRLFFMACQESFRFGGGREWFVSHYRFAKR